MAEDIVRRVDAGSICISGLKSRSTCRFPEGPEFVKIAKLGCIGHVFRICLDKHSQSRTTTATSYHQSAIARSVPFEHLGTVSFFKLCLVSQYMSKARC